MSICKLSVPLAFGALLFTTPVFAASQHRVALLPTQYFNADAQSAAAVTQGLTSALGRKGLTVVSVKAPRGYGTHRNYSDRAALRFARSVHAEYVAYPRLMAVGLPAARAKKLDLPVKPSAVILLRIINVRTGRASYGRQIGHEFVAQPGQDGRYHLTSKEAAAAAKEVLSAYQL